MVPDMPDYGFYRDVYLGSAIPESAYTGMIARAGSWLRQLENSCRVVSYGEESRKLALCAAAETLYFHGSKQGIAQTSVGGVTVRYEQGGVPLQRLLLQAVGGFLEVYRGVS